MDTNQPQTNQPEEKKKRGGFRPGSGRKPGSMLEETKQRIEMKRRWIERVHKIADKVFDAHEDIALGHYAEIMTDDGKVRVYKKSPNPTSLEWIMEHIWGKAPIKLTVDGDMGASESLTPETQAAITRAINYALPESERSQQASEADHPRPDVPEDPSGK